MTTLTRQGTTHGWPVLVIAGAGCVFFAYATYATLRLTIFAFIEAEPDVHLVIVAVATMIAMAYGLFLEVRTFVHLLKGTSTSFLNMLRAAEIHIRIFLGVNMLISGPVMMLANFPQTYEHIAERLSQQDAIDPEFTKIMIVMFEFLAAAMFIKWGWSFLKGVQETTNQMVAPSDLDDDEGLSESAQS